MNHENSYTEMMKSTAMQKQLGKETFMVELYVDMMLQEALLKNEKDKILVKIDEALDQRNKLKRLLFKGFQRNEENFHHYCKQLQEITQQFGT